MCFLFTLIQANFLDIRRGGIFVINSSMPSRFRYMWGLLYSSFGTSASFANGNAFECWENLFDQQLFTVKKIDKTQTCFHLGNNKPIFVEKTSEEYALQWRKMIVKFTKKLLKNYFNHILFLFSCSELTRQFIFSELWNLLEEKTQTRELV